jgi:hypothetical protein
MEAHSDWWPCDFRSGVSLWCLSFVLFYRAYYREERGLGRVVIGMWSVP